MLNDLATMPRPNTHRRVYSHAVDGPREPEAMPVEAVLRTHYRMTPREAQVAMLLAFRCSNKEVACRLGIALDTARHHTAAVLSKLGLSSRREVRDRLGTPQPYRPGFFGQPEGLFQ